MVIGFENVVPVPLEGVFDAQSQIWGQNVEFDTTKRYKIFAPSGTGKSTFVHCIYGLRNDYSGNVTVEGKSVKKMSSSDITVLRRDKFSVVFQDLRLFLDLNGEENLRVKWTLYAGVQWEEVLEMCQALQIDHLLTKKARHMSYGERQRFAIVRALIQPFKFLMMDEPFSHLDEENIKKACELIKTKCVDNNAGFAVASLGYDYFFEYDETKQL